MSERILIIKIAALGDAVMASTLVTAIRRKWPHATIGWVAGTSIVPFARLLSGVDEVIEVDDRALLGGNRVKALGAMLSAWRRIGRRWDRAFVAHTDARYALLSRFSGARVTRRFSDALAPRKGRWHGSEYPRLADEQEAGATARDFPELMLHTLPRARVPEGEGPLVVVAPGGARNLLRDDSLRRWPADAWAAAVRALVESGNRVVAVGGADDAAECARCEQEGAANYVGRLSLPELISLLNDADLVITHDSGPMHLALCLNRPVIALFGPTSPVERVPEGANAVVLTRAGELACAPCYNGFGFAPCASNLCLSRVPALEVIAAAHEMLAAAAPRLQVLP